MQKATYQIRNSEFNLSPADIGRLIRGARRERDRLMVEILAYTGIRRGELRMLRKGDLDAEESRLIIRRGKGGKQRVVFVPASLSQSLARYAEGHESDLLFPGRSGGPMSLRNVNYVIGRVGRDAAVRTPNPRYRTVGPHLLRHSFARNWKRRGGSIESLQKILGHASVKTTLDCYGNEDQREVEANYRRLQNSLVD
jgi:integrase